MKFKKKHVKFLSIRRKEIKENTNPDTIQVIKPEYSDLIFSNQMNQISNQKEIESFSIEINFSSPLLRFWLPK